MPTVQAESMTVEELVEIIQRKLGLLYGLTGEIAAWQEPVFDKATRSLRCAATMADGGTLAVNVPDAGQRPVRFTVTVTDPQGREATDHHSVNPA